MSLRPPLSFAFLLPFACTPAQTQQPATAAEEQTRVPSDFGRFVRVGDGGHLDTAIVTYRNKDGAEVKLFAAVHIADHALYEELQRRFQACDALLYELVGPENYRPKPGQRGDSWVSMLQTGLKNALELDFQLDAVNYDQPNFVHADMTPQEFAAAQEKAGESILGLMWRAMMQELKRAREGDNTDPGLAELAKMDLVTAFRKGEGRHLLRMVFASQLQNVERVAAGFSEDGKGSVLVEGRNEKCLTVLQRELKAGKKKLGIYYGAAHLPSMEQRLTKDLGFTKVAQEWLVAWDCTKRPDKKPAQADRLEGIMLAAQLKKANADVKAIEEFAKLYMLTHTGMEVPTMEKLTKPDDRGQVMMESENKDPWGTPYEIRRGEARGEFAVVSAGPDRTFGTADDISSKKPAEVPAAGADGPKRMKAMVDLRAITGAINVYLLTHDSRELPTMAMLTKADAQGNVALPNVDKDPWGTAYQIRPGKSVTDFEVVSAGPDRAFGTEDDLSSKKGEKQ